ncbi:MAG: nucleotide sugar dehydrogenase [Actinomycetota bacterium]
MTGDRAGTATPFTTGAAAPAPEAGDALRLQRVVVVGQGYVGLPLAMRAVEVGFDVVGFDSDKRKISALAAGESYIDDVTDADVTAALATGSYLPSETEEDLTDFDVAVITVPTPLTDGAPDISYIEQATATVARYLTAGATVILESTTYPGTTEEVVAPMLEAASGLRAGSDFHLGYSPERIDPGNEIWDFKRTPKVVSGIDADSLGVVRTFYDRLVESTVPVKGTREAELTKLLENTFRHVNIALVNELAIHARSMGIDFWDVIQGASTKPFGFMPFYPGPGVGGHCLPVDPSYLSWRLERQLGTVSRFVKIANDINNGMPAYVAGRIQAGLNRRSKPVNGSRILVLGLAYKKNSNDARETPSTDLILRLLDLGADVRAHDTHVRSYELDDRITRVETLSDEELDAADAVVLVTDHDDVDYHRVVGRCDYVLDTRRRLADRAPVEHL